MHAATDKKIVLLITSLFFSMYAVGQTSTNKPIDTINTSQLNQPEAIKGNKVYIKAPELNKFAGKWVWKNGNKSLILNLNKTVHHYGAGGNILDLEIIQGGYSYLKNGEQIILSADSALGGSSANNKDTLNIFIDIKSRKSRVALSAIYLPNNTIKLELDKNRFEFKNDENFELPMPLILIRQK
jgi:hypothetical protein